MKTNKLCLTLLLMSQLFINSVHAEETDEIDAPVDRSIQIIERKSPMYPSIALAHQIEGWVKVVFTLKADGEIVDVGIVDASPKGVFESAAIAAVKQFKILPPIKNGVAIDQRATQTIGFELPADYQQKAAAFEEQTRLNILSGNFDLNMMQTPDDLQWLITAIDSKSDIKLHTRTLHVLELEIEPDANGHPSSVAVIRNELGNQLSTEQIDALKQEVLFWGLKSFQFFNGYYDPIFTLKFAKNKPAAVESQMVAKSMPIPELRIDHTIRAELTIDAEGNLIDIQDAQANGEPIATHLVRDIFKILEYSSATRNYLKVIDHIEVSITMTLVQKDHIEMIKSETF